ncbi:hypothetical protein [Desulfatibacillum alkenivorans]|uniref:hypothetical protein n=1 Tax=Desulfatibacillum alkenivorans TaxID=259354 RepID=UPI0011149A0F|nr:hypothetical protein [Desulfatibacillum alkenivorans]
MKNHLANEFKAEVFKVNAPFAGGDDYHQGRLNGIKAEELRERFELAGALVEVIETVKCPMCGKVLDAGENCPDCFEEREPQAIEDAGALDIAPEIAKPQRDNAAFGEGVDDKEELRLEGMVRFRRGVILFSVLFLLHSFIGRERAFAISWIYLLPVPYFLGACYNLAKHKGYSTKFGLLGILSLLGATVMLLLPNKSQGGEHGRFLKKDIVVGSVLAAFLLIFPISAGTGAHKIKSYSGEFEVYREKLIHSDAQEPMDVMVAELESFIDHSFSIQSSMKPRTLEALENAEKMITILEFFFIRLQRLQALQMQTEAGVSPDFTDASLAGLQHRIMTDFKKKTSNERTGVTSHAFQVWLHLTQTSVKMVKDKKIKPFIKCLNESFEVLNDQLAIYMGENFLTPPIHVDQIFNAPNYADFPADYKSVSKEKLEEYVTINVSENGFITFTIKANEEFPSWTAGKTVVFIPTATKKIDFRGRVKYLFKIKRVGGNLQDAFLEKRNVLYEATRQFQLRL